MPLQISDVDAYAGHGENQPCQRTYEAHEELREVFVRGFLIRNKSLGVHWDFLYLRNVVVLMRPDLEGRWILFVHHTYALGIPSLDLQCGELFLQSCNELVAVFSLACSLEVVDMSTQEENQSFGRNGIGKS